jgi:uncharacterized coiled-coil protein SlyX
VADEIENHTIRLLQEMRAEMNARFDHIDRKFDAVNGRLDAVEERLEHFDTRLTGQSVMLTMITGMVAQQDERIERLERRGA